VFLRITKSFKEKKKTETYGSVYSLTSNTFIDVNFWGLSGRAHFVRGFFSQNEIKTLHNLLLQAPSKYWERKEDKRGYRRFLYSGHWKHRFYHQSYPAGKAGKLEITNPYLRDTLVIMGQKISRALFHLRPDICQPLIQAGFQEQDFGFFHLFMCPAGKSVMHTDDNDFISCLFVIHQGRGRGNGLHLGGCQFNLDMTEGDLVIMDSDVFFHGTPSYTGREDPQNKSEYDRLVGLFIIHRKFMIMKGVASEQLERSSFFQRQTTPPPNVNFL
jgi:hypothetical protein